MTKRHNIISVSILIIVWILFITTVKSAQDDLYAENNETNKQVTVVTTAKPGIEENDIVQSCEVHPTYWMDNDEYELFAKCVEAEAGTEGFTGKQYVVDVILNRVDSDKYPNTVKDVIMQKHQFEVVSNGRIYDVTPTEETCRAINTELESQLDNEIIACRLAYKIFGYRVIINKKEAVTYMQIILDNIALTVYAYTETDNKCTFRYKIRDGFVELTVDKTRVHILDKGGGQHG